MSLKLIKKLPDVGLNDFIKRPDLMIKYGINARTLEHKVKMKQVYPMPYMFKKHLIFEETARLLPYQKGRPKGMDSIIRGLDSFERYIGL